MYVAQIIKIFHSQKNLSNVIVLPNMTGGFNINVRGIEINITKTLNNFYRQNKKIYTKKEWVIINIL
jgi:hypothetical protein